MSDPFRCSGYIADKVPRCRHGFRTSIGCWPLSEEQAARSVPMCCDEEAAAELFEFNGGVPIWLEGSE